MSNEVGRALGESLESLEGSGNGARGRLAFEMTNEHMILITTQGGADPAKGPEESTKASLASGLRAIGVMYSVKCKQSWGMLWCWATEDWATARGKGRDQDQLGYLPQTIAVFYTYLKYK